MPRICISPPWISTFRSSRRTPATSTLITNSRSVSHASVGGCQTMPAVAVVRVESCSMCSIISRRCCHSRSHELMTLGSSWPAVPGLERVVETDDAGKIIQSIVLGLAEDTRIDQLEHDPSHVLTVDQAP